MLSTRKCTFTSISELGLSEEGMEDVRNSPTMYSGDANRTLYSLHRFLTGVTFRHKADINKVNDAISELGGLAFIDLES